MAWYIDNEKTNEERAYEFVLEQLDDDDFAEWINDTYTAWEIFDRLILCKIPSAELCDIYDKFEQAAFKAAKENNAFDLAGLVWKDEEGGE